MQSTRRRPGPILFALIVLALHPRLVAADQAGGWSPMSSERLVRLPPQYLKKSLEHDFAASGLAQALRQVDERIGLKGQTIAELRDAVGQAEGETEIELRHRLLAEKQAYIEQMSERVRLRRQGLMARRSVLEQGLNRLESNAPAASEARAELMARQDKARSRFQAASTRADIAAMALPGEPQSSYSRAHAANVAAIERLANTIARHPLNASASRDATPRSRQDVIRDLLGETEAQLALLDQEVEIIGHMARLVALDATAVSLHLTQGDSPENARSDGLGDTVGAASAVDLFAR